MMVPSAIDSAPSEIVNVLLVDDIPQNLLVLEATLDGLGLNLVKASSGAEALRHLLKQDFAVVLLDVQMPGMNGFETAALIRERDRSRHTPIMFITAVSTSETDAFKGYAVGAVDYVFKPIVPEILRAKVRVFVELYEKTAQAKRQAEQLERHAAEIERLNHDLKRQAAKLANANSELEAFSYSVSHDLRAPLRAMQSFTQFLVEDYGDHLDETGRDYCQRIAAAARRMDELIQDVLAYSRLSRADIHIKALDLDQVVNDILLELGDAIQEKNAQITVERPLPTAIGAPVVLRQVVANLLNNAIKFVAPGVQPSVRIWAESTSANAQPTVRLWFEDNGIGIAPEHQERIFSPFERLHGIETYPGTGIGLAIVRKGMERIGGHAGVESELGRGSRFWVELPGAPERKQSEDPA